MVPFGYLHALASLTSSRVPNIAASKCENNSARVLSCWWNVSGAAGLNGGCTREKGGLVITFCDLHVCFPAPTVPAHATAGARAMRPSRHAVRGRLRRQLLALFGHLKAKEAIRNEGDSTCSKGANRSMDAVRQLPGRMAEENMEGETHASADHGNAKFAHGRMVALPTPSGLIRSSPGGAAHRLGLTHGMPQRAGSMAGLVQAANAHARYHAATRVARVDPHGFHHLTL